MRTAKIFAEETQPVMLSESAGLEVNEASRPVATGAAMASVAVSVDKTPRPRLLSRRLARQARRAAR